MMLRGASLSDGFTPNRCRFSLPDDRQKVVFNPSTIIESGLAFVVSVIHKKEARNSRVLVSIFVEYNVRF